LGKKRRPLGPGLLEIRSKRVKAVVGVMGEHPEEKKKKGDRDVSFERRWP